MINMEFNNNKTTTAKPIKYLRTQTHFIEYI